MEVQFNFERVSISTNSLLIYLQWVQARQIMIQECALEAKKKLPAHLQNDLSFLYALHLNNTALKTVSSILSRFIVPCNLKLGESARNTVECAAFQRLSHQRKMPSHWSVGACAVFVILQKRVTVHAQSAFHAYSVCLNGRLVFQL